MCAPLVTIYKSQVGKIEVLYNDLLFDEGKPIKKLCIEEGEERTIIHSLKKKKFSFGNVIYHLYLTVIVV